MKTVCLIFFFSALVLAGKAQPQDPAVLHETAKQFLKQGDYANAVLVLQRCHSLAPENLAYTKDLALAHYFKKDIPEAMNLIKPALDRPDTDEQCYQIAGNLYREQKDWKECEKLYRKGLKKFPRSGALHAELGELLWMRQDYTAIEIWEQGIEADPGFSKNYYHAARYYFLTTDKVRSLFYGEIFLNMEPMSINSPEVKYLLLEGYKKLFTGTPGGAGNKSGAFDRLYLETMLKQEAPATAGISPETLTMIRTRFLLDWVAKPGPAHKLFEFHQLLLREGLFPAYNQWLFGPAQDLQAYQIWVNQHARESTEFARLQQSRVFKVPEGQYYKP